MDWIKISTDSILLSNHTKKELVALFTYQALYSQLENKPSDRQLKRYLSKSEIEFVAKYMQSIDKVCEKQIEIVIKKRGINKQNYEKNQELNENSDILKNSDRQLSERADKIRLDKSIKNTKKEIDIEGLYNTLTKNKPIVKKLDFNKFYENYPKKVSKVQAEKVWDRLTLDIQTKCIEVVSSNGFKNWVKEQDLKFIKHPSTWLNQGCWEDDVFTNNKVMDAKEKYRWII